jgi:hypothetical protein
MVFITWLAIEAGFYRQKIIVADYQSEVNCIRSLTMTGLAHMKSSHGLL